MSALDQPTVELDERRERLIAAMHDVPWDEWVKNRDAFPETWRSMRDSRGAEADRVLAQLDATAGQDLATDPEDGARLRAARQRADTIRWQKALGWSVTSDGRDLLTLDAEVARLHAVETTVRDLHVADSIFPESCTECSDYGTDDNPSYFLAPWPCATRRAVDRTAS